MSSRFDGAVPFARAVFDEFKEENVTFMAGSIAYQAFASLIPLLILLFFAISLVGDQALVERVTALTQSFLPQNASELLGNAVGGSAGSTGASVIGLVTLLWATLKIFRGLDTAFSEIYDSEAENSFLDQLTDGLVVFLALGVAIVAAGAAGTAFATFEEVPFIGLLSPLLLVVGLTIAFFPMYYLSPDIDVSLREVLPGVVVAAVGWTALEALFQIYVSFADKTDAYGVIGAILILLTWLYFSGLVLLLGAVVNAVIAGRTGDAAGPTDSAAESAGSGIGSESDTPDDGVHAHERLSRAELALFFDELRTAFDGDGDATVRAGSDAVTVHPTEPLDCEIEVHETADGERVVVRTQWEGHS